ncbi:MAG: polyprenol monophosphomannose synthase [Candidatus Jordarchaeaceae archaeon]
MCSHIPYKFVEGNLNVNTEIGIILPTYCEAANIGNLICEIENLGLNVSILVVDDSSPDKTADIVRKLQRKYDNILLFVRSEKSGLGTAIRNGFEIFLSLKNPPKFVITMDADFSHDPKEILNLLAASKDGDLVVGSRYYHGNIVNWSFFRLLTSKIANFLASMTIRAGVHDYTSGMRCYSVDLLKRIIGKMHSQTYEIQLETIRQASLRKFKIKETPITFVNRKMGKSKLSFNEIKDFLSYIINIYRKC